VLRSADAVDATFVARCEWETKFYEPPPRPRDLLSVLAESPALHED
jgi:hypothetical protein